MSKPGSIDDDVILDTSVISELASPEPDADVLAYLHTVSSRSYITTIVLAELHLGVELCPEGRRRRRLTQFVDDVRDAYTTRTIPFTADAAQHYAASVARMRARGLAIGVNDAYIAATAVTTGAILATRNTKDFRHYPGIRLRDPWTGPAERRTT